MLIAAVSAALAAGVLVAHTICISMFTLFRIHATQVAARKTIPQAASQPASQAHLAPLGN